MKQRFFSSAILCALISTYSFTVLAAPRTELILDVSGSMNAAMGAEKRIDAARKAVFAAMGSIPDDSIVALRLYSHRIPKEDKVASCKDTELVVPFGAVGPNRARISDIVNKATPLGYTPIAYSLEQAANDFAGGSDEQPVIILASDGEETCGGDPVAVAKALLAKGFKVIIHTIGIDVDSTTRAQLEAISNATGGKYKDAKDAAGLIDALKQLTEEAFIKKGSDTMGEAIRGGDSFDTAVQIIPGKLYHLDHHQRKNQYDYFYVEANGGEGLEASTETTAQGIEGEGATPKVNDMPYAGITLLNPQRQKAGSKDIIGTKNAKETVSTQVPAGGAGHYYIMIGNSYNAQHKDTRFHVDVSSKSDANSRQDAGSTDATALEVAPGTYEKNYLSKTDPVDVFKFKAAAEVPYEIIVKPENEAELNVKVADPDGIQLASVDAYAKGSAIKVENVKLNRDGYVYIRVMDHWGKESGHEVFDTKDTVYTLTIRAGIANPAPVAATVPVVEKKPEEPKPVATPVVPTSKPSASSAVSSEQTFIQTFKSLPFLKKAKIIFLYGVVPCLATFLIGFIIGYIRGRITGKRKTLAKMGQAGKG